LRKYPKATVRQTMKAAEIKSMQTFYKIFPDGLEEVCKHAEVPFEKKRTHRIEKTTVARSAMPFKVSQDQSALFQFEMVKCICTLEAGINALNKEFQNRTEADKENPYWFAQRKHLADLRDWFVAILRNVHDEKGCDEAREVYRGILGEFIRLMGELPRLEQSRLVSEKLQACFQCGLDDALKKGSMVFKLVEEHGLDKVDVFLRSEGLLAYDVNVRGAIAKKWTLTGWVPPGLDNKKADIMYEEEFEDKKHKIPLLEIHNANTYEEL